MGKQGRPKRSRTSEEFQKDSDFVNSHIGEATDALSELLAIKDDPDADDESVHYRKIKVRETLQLLAESAWEVAKHYPKNGR